MLTMKTRREILEELKSLVFVDFVDSTGQESTTRAFKSVEEAQEAIDSPFSIGLEEDNSEASNPPMDFKEYLNSYCPRRNGFDHMLEAYEEYISNEREIYKN